MTENNLPNSTQNNTPIFQLAIASILFGLGAIFVVFIQLDAVVIAFYRLLIGAALFGVILIWQRQSFAINQRALFFAALSGIMLGIDLAFWNQSIFYVGPGIATILNSLQIFFMAGFGIVLFRDKPGVRLWVSLCLSFFGVVLLCSNEIHATDKGTVGVVVGIASGITFAISMLALRQVAAYQKQSLTNTMFYSSVAGALATGLYAALTDRNFITYDAPSWFMMAIYGSVVHVLAWYLMAKAMPFLSVAIVGLLMTLEPVIVIVIDVAFLDKALTVWQVTGAILTIYAIYMGSQSRAKPPPKKSKNIKNKR